MEPLSVLFGLGAAACYALVIRAWVHSPAPGDEPSTGDHMHEVVAREDARRSRLRADEVVTKGIRAAVEDSVAEDRRLCDNLAAWVDGGACLRCGVPHRPDPPPTPVPSRGRKVWS